jgi:hypothetical protein
MLRTTAVNLITELLKSITPQHSTMSMALLAVNQPLLFAVPLTKKMVPKNFC